MMMGVVYLCVMMLLGGCLFFLAGGLLFVCEKDVIESFFSRAI